MNERVALSACFRSLYHETFFLITSIYGIIYIVFNIAEKQYGCLPFLVGPV